MRLNEYPFEQLLVLFENACYKYADDGKTTSNLEIQHIKTQIVNRFTISESKLNQIRKVLGVKK